MKLLGSRAHGVRAGAGTALLIVMLGIAGCATSDAVKNLVDQSVTNHALLNDQATRSAAQIDTLAASMASIHAALFDIAVEHCEARVAAESERLRILGDREGLRLKQRFDDAALTMLLSTFPQRFESVYLGALQPSIDRSEQDLRRARAEKVDHPNDVSVVNETQRLAVQWAALAQRIASDEIKLRDALLDRIAAARTALWSEIDTAFGGAVGPTLEDGGCESLAAEAENLQSSLDRFLEEFRAAVTEARALGDRQASVLATIDQYVDRKSPFKLVVLGIQEEFSNQTGELAQRAAGAFDTFSMAVDGFVGRIEAQISDVAGELTSGALVQSGRLETRVGEVIGGLDRSLTEGLSSAINSEADDSLEGSTE
jgi:hypothetical protein